MTRVFLILLPLLLAGCSTAHHARPLGKGNQAVHLSVGGPVAGIGTADTFAPFITATYKVGVTDRADVFVGWHVLETFVNNGNLYFDVGASYYLLDQKGALPGVSAAFTISPLITKDAGWASFDLSVTASWAIGKRERHLVYVGMHNFLLPVRTQFVETAQYVWAPYLGGQLRLGKKREIGLGLEIQWHRPYHDTSDAVVAYVAPGNLGAMAFMGGFTVFIGKDMKPSLALLEATDPVADPEPTEPVAEPEATEPVAEPEATEPTSTEATEPTSTEAAEPAEPEPTDPAESEATEPAAEPTDPAPEPTDPAPEATDPAPPTEDAAGGAPDDAPQETP